MLDDYEIAQRGGFRGGGFRGGFPRGGFPGRFPMRFPGRFPMRFPGRFPMRFPGRFPMRFRRFPRFFFFPTFFPGFFPQGGCAFIDQFGRCCDGFGRCFDDFGFDGVPFASSEDSVAAWSPSESWERIEETDEDYYDQY